MRAQSKLIGNNEFISVKSGKSLELFGGCFDSFLVILVQAQVNERENFEKLEAYDMRAVTTKL